MGRKGEGFTGFRAYGVQLGRLTGVCIGVEIERLRRDGLGSESLEPIAE